LRAWNLTPLESEDFSHTDLQIIFNGLKAALDQHQLEPVEFLGIELDENVTPQLHKLLQASQDISAEDRKRVDDVLSAVIRLRKRNIDAALQELRFLQENAYADADQDQAHLYQEQIYNLVQALQKVTNALKHYLRRAERLGAVGLN
jgi:phosphoglycerate-specific signal transduction histidine kinase